MGNTVVPGLYSATDFSIEGGGIGYIAATTTDTVQFNLTNFGNVGEYIDMTFNGKAHHGLATQRQNGIGDGR